MALRIKSNLKNKKEYGLLWPVLEVEKPRSKNEKAVMPTQIVCHKRPVAFYRNGRRV